MSIQRLVLYVCHIHIDNYWLIRSTHKLIWFITRNFSLHLVNLFEFGVIGPSHVFTAISRLQVCLKKKLTFKIWLSYVRLLSITSASTTTSPGSTTSPPSHTRWPPQTAEKQPQPKWGRISQESLPSRVELKLHSIKHCLPMKLMHVLYTNSFTGLLQCFRH